MAGKIEAASSDVIIVGGGPAGLSAALVLGRSRRRVVLFDAGQPRNYAAREMHGYLGRDCSDPADLRREGRAQLERYDSVELRDVAVHDARPKAGGFEVEIEGGGTLFCRKLLLATGVKDNLPQVEGFKGIYGVSAHHCPYCDGWEWRDRPFAAYGRGERGKKLALELLGWSADVVLFTDGPAELSGEDREELRRHGIGLEEEAVARFEHQEGQLRAIRLASGSAIERGALFFALGTEQSCGLASGLGCHFNDRGAVDTGSLEETNVPGLFVAGDASRHVGLAIVAAAEGARAAFAINGELLEEDRQQAPFRSVQRRTAGG